MESASESKPKLAGGKRWWVGCLQAWLWSWTWDFRKTIRPRKLPVFRNRKSLILESRIEEILLVESRILDFGIKESHGIPLTMESSLFGIHSVESRKFFFGCANFGESKNRFLILDLPDFSVERNAKSEIGFLTFATFRKRVQYAWQPLKKWRVLHCLTN